MSAAPPTDTWADTFEDAHRQATSNHTVLLQGYAVRLSGTVSPLAVAEGRASALVTPRHEEPCQAHLHITALTDAEQDAFLGALATSRHRASVVRGQLPPALLSADAAGEVPLAPAPDQIAFACSCRQAPCQHTAALGHALVEHLRAHPGDWLTLRGLPLGRLTSALNERASAPAAVSPPAPATVSSPSPETSPAAAAAAGSAVSRAYLNAHHAYQANPGPLPRPHAAEADAARPLLHRPGLAPPPQEVNLDQVRGLAAAAARQAAALLGDGTPLEIDPVLDAVRHTAALPAAQRTEDTAYRLGLEPAALRRLLTAFSQGGTPAADAALRPQPIPPDALATALAAITPLRPASRTPLTTGGNQITDTALGIALRRGPDGRWFPFAADEQDWECLAAPSDDAATAYRAALSAKRSRARASLRP
ncbi:hypothetical protein [Streptomyces sp. NPDC051546]|uniref:hypothetical protein n=1 Tax=Streptomyces sp. NPDC051546 TaxID=3365655 RepID=UPI0037B9569A